MKLPSGLEILEDRMGTGPAASKGDYVTYNVRIFLNRGDEVHLNEAQVQDMPDERVRHENGKVLIDHVTRLGTRQAIAGIEKALFGMQAGAHRKVRISPHLAYGAKGIPGFIPGDAVLNVHIWVRDVTAGT